MLLEQTFQSALPFASTSGTQAGAAAHHEPVPVPPPLGPLLAPPPTRRIIPEANPWSFFRASEEESAGYDDRMPSGGLGTEGTGGDGDDEVDPALGSEEAAEDGARARSSTGARRWKHPAWLTAQYKSWITFLDSTRDSTKRCAAHRPSTFDARPLDYTPGVRARLERPAAPGRHRVPRQQLRARPYTPLQSAVVPLGPAANC